MVVKHSKPAVSPHIHGEDFLAGLSGVRITLESGETITFNRKEELVIPEDPVRQVVEARRAPARLSFWLYQKDRALKKVRELELAQSKVDAELALTYRNWFLNETDERIVTDSMVRDRLHFDQRSQSAQIQLNEARNQLNLLQSVCECVEHRCFILRRLIARDTAEYGGG
jgi:hypothetical protein